MLAHSKLVLTATIIAVLSIPGAAQSFPPNPLQCVANGGVPPILRAEGLAEQVGDVVLSCTGGAPTAPGQLIPQVNIQVFLSTPITSRLTNTSNAQWSSALLIIDEAHPPGTPGTGSIYPTQSFCSEVSGCPMTGLGANANPAVEGNAYGLPRGSYLAPYSGAPGTNSYNVFQGQQVATNSVAFLGVPFDSPGTLGGVRTIRITNLRTAPGPPSSSLIPHPVIEYISITGAVGVPVNNPQQIVGYSQFGLDRTAAFVTTPQDFSACYGSNAISDGALRPDMVGSQLYLTAPEGFASAFKVRNYVQVSGGSAGAPATDTDAAQDLPGFIYNTETGFYTPTSALNGLNIGLASNGTRVMFTLHNTPTGSSVYVPNVLPLFQKGGTSTVTGWAVLLPGADTSGSTGGFNSAGGHSAYFSGMPAVATVKATAAQLGNAFNSSTSSNGSMAFTPGFYPVGIPADVTPGLIAVPPSGVVVYEIVQTNTSAMEQLSLPLVVSYSSAPAPAAGVQATADVSFAPISPTETSATASASASLPIPRFIAEGPNGSTFRFSACGSNTCGVPVIDKVSASPNVLWPPNDKLVAVNVAATVTDTCPAVCRITAVTSDEPASGDWSITGDLTLLLRATRLGNGDGRVYTITVQCTDTALNTASKNVTVTVPHDQRRPGDVNGDDKVDCTDVLILKSAFGKRVGQPGFYIPADLNADGVVDVRDLAIVSQKLPAGKRCQ